MFYFIGLVTALLTAFYMTPGDHGLLGRLVCMRRAEHGAQATSKPHEAPPMMPLPLVALAILSIVGGLRSTPRSEPGSSTYSTRLDGVRRGGTTPTG